MSNEDDTRLIIDSDGIKIPDIETIYNKIMNEWSTVFGEELRIDNRLSPQGQLARSIAQQIDFKNKEIMYFINQFNTNTANGNFLDYQYNNFGIYRNKQEKSTVLCNCLLEPGTTINIGDEVQSINGDIFVSTENYTAPEPDPEKPQVVDIEFKPFLEDEEEINIPPHTITITDKEVSGWLAVDNENPGKSGIPTTVTCQCTLLPGTKIEGELSMARNEDNDLFVPLEDFTLPNNEDEVSAQIVFVAKEPGPIRCDSGTITTIVTQKEGWISVNNTSDGIVGTSGENDDEFRIRAMNSHQINALGTTRAIYARLMEITGVQEVYIRDNRTKELVQEDSINITANSTYIAIRYDLSEITKVQIANVLHLTCSTATYIGNTSVDIQIENAPAGIVDTVCFQTALPQQVFLKVEIRNLPNYSETTDNTIKEIILNNFNGKIENIQPCGIGDLIEANRFFENLIYLQGTNEAIISTIKIGFSNESLGEEVKIPITHYPILIKDNISVEKKSDMTALSGRKTKSNKK